MRGLFGEEIVETGVGDVAVFGLDLIRTGTGAVNPDPGVGYQAGILISHVNQVIGILFAVQFLRRGDHPLVADLLDISHINVKDEGLAVIGINFLDQCVIGDLFGRLISN